MKVSFVIPSYNCVTWLAHAIESCQQQTHKDIEIVVVNDASTDSTKDLLDYVTAQDSRIVAIHNAHNLGRSESRNIGNHLSTGDVICVLDADDLADKKRAELTVRKIKSGSKFVHGSATAIDCLGFPVDAPMLGFPGSRHSADYMNKSIAFRDKVTRIVHSTVAYTRDIAEKYKYEGGEIANLGIDDWHQQMRIFMDDVPYAVIPQNLAFYRVLPSSITNNRDMVKVMAEKNKFLEGMKVNG